jgi:hypothetical protein
MVHVDRRGVMRHGAMVGTGVMWWKMEDRVER